MDVEKIEARCDKCGEKRFFVYVIEDGKFYCKECDTPMNNEDEYGRGKVNIVYKPVSKNTKATEEECEELKKEKQDEIDALVEKETKTLNKYAKRNTRWYDFFFVERSDEYKKGFCTVGLVLSILCVLVGGISKLISSEYTPIAGKEDLVASLTRYSSTLTTLLIIFGLLMLAGIMAIFIETEWREEN